MFKRSLSVLLLSLASVASAQESFIIRGARVFDGTQSIGVRDVLVRAGRIAEVAPTIAAAQGVEVVDAAGRTLLPGFIDAHTHTFADVLSQALAFGVTTQLEMFTAHQAAAQWRREQESGRANARTDVYSAGTLVTAARGHGTQFGLAIPTIGTPDSAQAFVDARIAEGSDYIKIVYDDGSAYALSRPTLDRATMKAVVDAGLTPAEALAAATANVARAFRFDDRGRIAPGMRADLVLVRGDPTSDITATRAIEAVWKGGVRFDRRAYAARAARTRGAVATRPTIEPGAVSNFDDGNPTARFGMGWVASTDAMAGGKSTAELQVVDGGAQSSAKALRVTGTVDGGLPYAWAGAAFMPASAPMQPVDVSAAQAVSFWARGDGKTYRVMLFAQSRGMTPLMRTFTSTAEWKEHTIPLSAFGTDGKDLLMIVIAAGPAPGPFELLIDDVRLP